MTKTPLYGFTLYRLRPVLHFFTLQSFNVLRTSNPITLTKVYFNTQKQEDEINNRKYLSIGKYS
jgi:hypothetical protein